MPNSNYTVQRAQNMLNQMKAQEEQNADTLNQLAQSEASNQQKLQNAENPQFSSMAGAEGFAASTLNQLQANEQQAAQQIQQMSGMLNQMSSSAGTANFEFGSDFASPSGNLAANANIGANTTAALASDATQGVGQSVTSYYQGSTTGMANADVSAVNTTGLANNAGVSGTATTGLASSEMSEMSDYGQSY